MYAIVKTGGKQYRVERGQRLLIERLPAQEGADVSLQPILYRSEEAVFDKAGLERVQVTAKVLAHVRGEKLRVFKFKPKRGYKRRTGHRQDLTQIEVTAITHGAGKAPAAKERSKPVAARPTPAEGADGAAQAPKARSGEAPETKGAQAESAAAPKAKAAAAPKAKAAAAPKAKAAETPEAEGAATAKAKPAAAPKAKAAEASTEKGAETPKARSPRTRKAKEKTDDGS
jgi:large subunit ribosomal protein L21